MKRALMFASVASMIQQFNMENIRLLLDLGYTVDVACNMEHGSTITAEKIAAMKQQLADMGVEVIHIPVPRKITAIGDIWKATQLTKSLMDHRSYDLIHCHSPIGGMICRLANRMSNHYRSTRMIYTAHGFHFFHGAPLLNWLLFYPAEAFCAFFTDTLITINREDYAAAQKFKLKKGGSVTYVPGIGVNLDRLAILQPDREKLCRELNIPQECTLMLSVGELNDNKNQQVVVEALQQLPANYHYIICGQGDLGNKLEALANDLGCAEHLHILGYRDDVISIMKSCDLFIFPSKREGLSVALMEAMACGLPCCASKIRGNCDLLSHGGGVLLNLNTFTDDLVKHLREIPDLAKYKTICKTANEERIAGFSRACVHELMRSIYAGSDDEQN